MVTVVDPGHLLEFKTAFGDFKRKESLVSDVVLGYTMVYAGTCGL